MRLKLTGLALAGALGVLAIAPQAHSSTSALPAGLTVYAGYTDNVDGIGAGKHPTPWRKSPGVIFKGCNYHKPTRCNGYRQHYDSGALRLDNDTSRTLFVSEARVRIGSCRFHPWRHLHVKLAPGKQLILTQTAATKNGPCGQGAGISNFDTSDTHLNTATQCTKDDGKIPVFRVLVNGQLLVYRDTNQILNTGGINPSDKSCTGVQHDETEPWSPL